MPFNNQTSFLSKIFTKFHIPNNMTLYHCVTNQALWITFMNFKCRSYILHFLHEYIPPKCIPIFFVQLFSFHNALRDPDAILVHLLPVFGFYLRYNPSFLLYHIRNPPSKCRFFMQSVLYCIFCQFH